MKQVTKWYLKAITALKSEDSVDALRNTFAVVLPIIVFLQLQWPITAIGVGVGALMLCMTDLPGNTQDKVRGAWQSVLLLCVIAFVTAWIVKYVVLMVLFILLLTFLMTMLSVFGQRPASIGLMAIILATFTIGLRPADPLLWGFYIAVGGTWYYMISLLQISLFPFRSLTRAITKTQSLTATLLLLRAKGYNPTKDLTGFNDKNIKLHLKITNEHETIRQLLLKDKKASYLNKVESRLLLEKSISLMDLYEQVSAVHHDYPYLREQFQHTPLLALIERMIKLLANVLTAPQYTHMLAEVDSIRQALAAEKAQLSDAKRNLLQQIFDNIDRICSLIIAVRAPADTLKGTDSERFTDFLTTVPTHVVALKDHMHFASPIFRFSLRLTLLSFVAITFIALYAEEHYSYWFLLTMVLVSRPSYGHTIKRNIDRILGTGAGLILGWTLANTYGISAQLYICIFTLYIFFAFNRLRYGISVVAITTTVVLCLNVYSGDLLRLVSDRLFFTIMGVALCLAAPFVFPIWNAPRLRKLLADVVASNSAYLHAVIHLQPHEVNSIYQTRLARKQSQQHLAAFSEAILAAQREPFKRNVNWQTVKQVQVLNYQINVLIAAYTNFKTQQNATEALPLLLQSQSELTLAIAAAANFKPTNSQVPKIEGQLPLDLLNASKRLVSILQQDQ